MPDFTIYTTASCPYCIRAKALLRMKHVPFREIAIDADPEARQEMTARAHGRRTVPQIFLNGVHIGDSDDLHELDRTGELDKLVVGLAR